MAKKINVGAVCAEIFAIRGGKAAAEFAARKGRSDLSEKISRGEFTAPRGKFNAARACARAAAMKELAA